MERDTPLTESVAWESLPESERDRESARAPALTYRQDVARRFKRNRSAVISFFFLVALVLAAVFGPSISGHTYKEQDLEKINIPPWYGITRIGGGKAVFLNRDLRVFRVDGDGRIQGVLDRTGEDLVAKSISYDFDGTAFSVSYASRPPRILDGSGAGLPVSKRVWNPLNLLGTDSLGRDMLVRLFYGARISLAVALIATLVNLLIGVAYGGISGYAGGGVDNAMMRAVDIIKTVPLTLYVILIMVVLDSGFLSIIVALGSVYWVDMARIVRGSVLSLREEEYILAARTIGTSPGKIITRHLLPNAMGPIVVTATMLIPQAIFIEAFLSFIGLGVSAPMSSWGTLCNDALETIRSYPYQIFLPAGAICLTMFAFNFLGDGLRDALDPKQR
jgi:oligopeptide transport system permease protein